MLPNSLFAQNSEETYGKSRIQYRYFEWKYYSTPHFDIYYYQGGQKLAKQVSENIEDDFLKITDIMGYAPYNKTKIFIFNSNLDFNQSNVGLNEAQFDISGQTNFLKTHLELAFEGSYIDFKEELIYKISKIYAKDMLFGGGIVSEVFQSNALFAVPDWFVSGIAAYIAYGWSDTMDDFVIDFLRRNPLKSLNKLEGKDAELAGQSVWNFISEKYGRINISNTLNLTRIIRNEEKSITNTLGIPFSAFLNEYRYFYLNSSTKLDTESPSKENRLSKRWRKDVTYQSKISPSGQFLAYSINNKGRYKVKLREISTGKEKTILKGGQKKLNDDFYKTAPAMDWGDSTTLGIVDYARGKNSLVLYNPYTKENQIRDLRRFDQINQLDIYPNGKTAVVSASVNAQSDLYLISTGRPNIRRLTNDIFDNLHPAFIPDTKRIIFSSNRKSDSTSNEYSYKDISDNYNLYELDLDQPNQLKQLTNNLAKNTMVVIQDSSAVFYLSEQSGIFNLYKLNLENSTSKQLTAFGTGIQSFDLRPEYNQFSFSIKQNGHQQLYFNEDFSGTESKFLPSTLRKQVELSRSIIVDKPVNRIHDKPNKDFDFELFENPINSKDSTLSGIGKALNRKEKSSTTKLNADDFEFETQAFKETKSKESSLLSTLSRLRNKASLMGPFDYEPSFTTNNVTASWLIDPLVGLSLYSRYQMNDLRENHKFYGGFDISLQNFKSGAVFGEYQYLERLVDYKIRFEREVYATELLESFTHQKYALNTFSVGSSYPISNSSSISVNPHLVYQQFVESSFNVLTQGSTLKKNPLQNDFLFGGKIEYIFDNSEPLGLNIRQGLRAKVAFENYTTGLNLGESFSKLYIDIRNYQKVFREITFATRLYVGGFFGKNSPYYMLGGVDNWMFKKIKLPKAGAEITPDENPLALTSAESPIYNSNILFHDFVTGLRGFQLNAFSGKSAALLSNELRIPVFRVLSNNTMTSNFARNFQIIGFYDIGTAWMGGSPWDQDNSINKQSIENDNFEAVVRNYKNPWLSSLGLGLRTTFLGYYVRLDYAFPIEDYNIQNPKLSLSIGYDF